MLLLVSLAACSDQSPEAKLEKEAVTISVWGSDPILVAAVKAQNAQNLTLAEILHRDSTWVAGTAQQLVTAVTTGACADRLRQLQALRAVYSESFAMDNKGALVCASDKTSDYWQGDEDKWIKSYNNGIGATFIDKAAFDASAQETLAQISFPVRDGGTVIGAITVGVRVGRL